MIATFNKIAEGLYEKFILDQRAARSMFYDFHQAIEKEMTFSKNFPRACVP